jgi:large subunit ribosomal protein L28
MTAKKIVNLSLGVLKSVKPLGPFDPSKTASQLPEEYKKFFREWQWQKPAPVHFIPEAGKWKRNPETGEV